MVEAVGDLERLTELDPQAGDYLQAGQEISAQLEELVADVRRYAAGLDQEPGRMLEVEARLDIIDSLKRKYGDTVAEILEYADEAAAELSRLQSSEDRAADLVNREQRLSGELAATCRRTFQHKRKAAVRELAAAVHEELALLGMPDMAFDVAVTQEEAPQGLSGTDRGRPTGVGVWANGHRCRCLSHQPQSR